MSQNQDSESSRKLFYTDCYPGIELEDDVKKEYGEVLYFKSSKTAETLSTSRIDVNSLQADLETEEYQIELLEKQSKLKKRWRKYKSSDPIESWSTRWVAAPIAYLFPEERREEWLGDLYEENREMFHKKYPQWFIHIINVLKTGILVISAFQIKLSDFISLGSNKSEK
jgi:hypothetical protein